jgi:hypothetical protein
VVYVERRGNGLAIAALVTGLVGLAVGLIPILFFVAWAAGITAFVLGLIARRRATREPEVGRKKMATWGTALGVLSIAIGIAGYAIVNDAFTDLDNELDSLAGNSEDPQSIADESQADSDGDGVIDTDDVSPDDSTVSVPDDLPPVEDSSPDTPEPPAADPAQTTVGLNEGARDDGLGFKVLSIEEVDSVPPYDEFANAVYPPPGGKLYKATLQVKNFGQTPADPLCGDGGAVLLDINDRNYHPVDAIDTNENVCLDGIAPGFNEQYVLAFKVPRRFQLGGLVLWNSDSEDYSGEESNVAVLP